MGGTRRLLIVVACGAVAIAGMAAWSYRQGVEEDRLAAKAACDQRSEALAEQAPLPASTPAQRKHALALVAADPLVRRVWGGVPPVAERLGGVGMFIHPSFPVFDDELLGTRTSVTVVLPSALPDGTYRWRTAEPVYRTNCEADGIASMTIRDVEGGPGAIGVGQPFAKTPVLMVDVSLTKKLVFGIYPNGGDPGTWRPVGEPITFSTS